MGKNAGRLLTLLILIGLISCSRHSSDGIDCISRVIPSTNPLISPAQLDSANSLFSKNNLSTAGLQFVFFATYSAGNTQVFANQFINGLLVVGYSDVVYNFDSTGIFISPVGGGYSGTLPDKDTTTRQSLESLRQSFLNNYRKCTIQGGVAYRTPYHPIAPYQDTCLVARLVYVDAATGQTGVSRGAALVKAWLVYPADDNPSSWPFPFPEVTVIDNTGVAIPEVLYIP